jgi:tetratricopeptide (TPR) repeat protein
MKYLYGIVCIVCFLLNGCAAKNIIDESKNAEMYLMVYDFENQGLHDVHIFIDDEELGKTDIYGRYILKLKEDETYIIRIEKNKYEAIEKTFVFDSLNVLYFQMIDSEELLHLAEDAMNESRYKDVIDFLDRSIKLDDTRIDAQFLKSIAYYKLGMNAEALSLLETLSSLIKQIDVIEELKQKIKTTNEDQVTEDGYNENV